MSDECSDMDHREDKSHPIHKMWKERWALWNERDRKVKDYERKISQTRAECERAEEQLLQEFETEVDVWMKKKRYR